MFPHICVHFSQGKHRPFKYCWHVPVGLDQANSFARGQGILFVQAGTWAQDENAHTYTQHFDTRHTSIPLTSVCSSSCCGDLVPWKLNFLLLPLSSFKTFNQEGELSLYAESCIMFYHMHNIIHVTPHHAILPLCIAEVMHYLAFASIRFYVMETPTQF